MSAPRKSAHGPGVASQIPDKLYFKIGEVAELVGVQPHVLRYWEKEIPFIRPGKTASNQRRYRRRDVEIFREIRRLLHEERYTLAGARRRVLAGDRGREAPPPVGEGAAAAGAPDGGRPATRAPGQPGGEPEAASGYEGAEPATPDAALGGSDEAGAARTTVLPKEAARCQLDLGFAGASTEERLGRVRAGLRDLIRLVGEEP